MHILVRVIGNSYRIVVIVITYVRYETPVSRTPSTYLYVSSSFTHALRFYQNLFPPFQFCYVACLTPSSRVHNNSQFSADTVLVLLVYVLGKMSDNNLNNGTPRKRRRLFLVNTDQNNLLEELVSDGLNSDVPTSVDPNSDDEEELLDFNGSDIMDPNWVPESDISSDTESENGDSYNIHEGM